MPEEKKLNILIRNALLWRDATYRRFEFYSIVS